MALIKLGGLAQDVRGSLNGTTFSRNRGGAYVRTKVSPVQPVSDWAAAARSIFTTIAKAWSGELDSGERTAWNTYAADHPFTNVFGDNIILPGIAMFQSINRDVLQIGGAIITDATSILVPALITPGATPVVTETANAIVHITALVAGTLGTNDKLVVMATPPQNPSWTIQKNRFRLLNIQTGAQPVVATDLKTLYNARFEDPYAPESYVIGFSIRVVDVVSGGHGVPLIITVPIAAAA